ncbi:MAG TPA: KH domain-containing protein [Acidimicrobiales bacterium]
MSDDVSDEFDDDDRLDDDGRDGDDGAADGVALRVLEYVVSEIVDDPDEVSIDEDRYGDSVRFDVTVASDDVGRVIGRRGRTAQAIRAVVRAAAAKEGAESEVEFLD